jgi:TonB family protein
VPPKEKEEVKGRVKDEHGEPIAGVSILIRGTAKGTISDIDGAFSIEAKSTDELVFSFIGMYSVETSASTLRGGEAIITMKEENMILCYEVVIIRHYPDAIYRRAPKKTTKMSYTEVRTVPVSPVGDLKDFQKWVQSNIRYSEQMKKDKIQGEVILSFAIDKKGRLTDKKVIGKLSKDADKEALRALSLSGAWEPGGHYGELIKTTMIISVNFGDE